jgi:Short C-terminal domain
MNQSNSESARLAREATAIFNRCGALSEEATRLFTESTNLSRKAKASFFGRSKLIAEARQLIDKGHALMSEEKGLMEEGNKLLEQSKKLKASEPVSNYVTCRCQHCDTGIEFSTAELSEENSVVRCPHCGLETKLHIPKPITNPSDEDALKKQKADFLASVEAERPESEAQLQKLKEIADQRLIYSKLDSLKLEGDCVKIHRRGIANALAAGLNGERTILISSLSSVQVKPGSWLSPGYILFSYAGSKPFMGGIIDATQDPDTFIFGQELNEEIAEFKIKVEDKMREARRPAPATNSSGGLTGEIRKLAELKQQGLLSQEEFEAAKRKLFS